MERLEAGSSASVRAKGPVDGISVPGAADLKGGWAVLPYSSTGRPWASCLDCRWLLVQDTGLLGPPVSRGPEEGRPCAHTLGPLQAPRPALPSSVLCDRRLLL